MRTYIYLILLLGIICSDKRKPSKVVKKCFIDSLGEEKAKLLFASFRKFHRHDGKMKFAEYINTQTPEHKELLEQCLAEKKRRLKLKRKKEDRKLSANMKQMEKALEKGDIKEALKKCKQMVKKKGFCKRFIKTYKKNYGIKK